VIRRLWGGGGGGEKCCVPNALQGGEHLEVALESKCGIAIRSRMIRLEKSFKIRFELRLEIRLEIRPEIRLDRSEISSCACEQLVRSAVEIIC